MKLPRYAPVIAIAAVCLLLGSTGGAVAGSLITSKQIKDNTLTTKDIKNKTIAAKDLAPGTVKSLKGKNGVSAWETIPSGKTVTGYFFQSNVSGSVIAERIENVNLPAKAPSAPTAYGIGADAFASTTSSASCTGTFAAPTAPPGQVCAYFEAVDGFDTVSIYGWDSIPSRTKTFYLSLTETAANTPTYYYGVWAYTAP